MPSDLIRVEKLFFLCIGLLQFVPIAGAAKRLLASRYFTDTAVLDLVDAAARGDVKGIDVAIKSGADVNAQGTDGFVPLAYAFLSMNTKGFSALLDRGADPNAKVEKLPGRTTSMVGLATQGDNTYWLKKLIEHGAEINFATSYAGRPPIMIAFMYDRFCGIAEVPSLFWAGSPASALSL
ncbi:MAG: ankyrin repeat domain-containing protein [Opitutaceae bacterium]